LETSNINHSWQQLGVYGFLPPVSFDTGAFFVSAAMGAGRRFMQNRIRRWAGRFRNALLNLPDDVLQATFCRWACAAGPTACRGLGLPPEPQQWSATQVRHALNRLPPDYLVRYVVQDLISTAKQRELAEEFAGWGHTHDLAGFMRRGINEIEQGALHARADRPPRSLRLVERLRRQMLATDERILEDFVAEHGDARRWASAGLPQMFFPGAANYRLGTFLDVIDDMDTEHFASQVVVCLAPRPDLAYQPAFLEDIRAELNSVAHEQRNAA
jgi:hypothetical protein